MERADSYQQKTGCDAAVNALLVDVACNNRVGQARPDGLEVRYFRVVAPSRYLVANKGGERTDNMLLADRSGFDVLNKITRFVEGFVRIDVDFGDLDFGVVRLPHEAVNASIPLKTCWRS